MVIGLMRRKDFIGLFKEDVGEVRAPGQDRLFNGFLLLSNFSRNGDFSNGFPLKPFMTFLDQVVNFLVSIQSQTLEKVIL